MAVAVGGSNNNLPITIAILENGNVDSDNSYLNHHASTLQSIEGELPHTTRVANVAASFHPTYQGMAKGATILSAGRADSMFYMHYSLNWALDNGAEVINVSSGWDNNTSNLEWIDRAFDYTARVRNAVIVKSAGNDPSRYVTSPGKAWNVITVGGTNDQSTSRWSDDTMYFDPNTGRGSAYLDPGYREKPEVVAPAQNLTMVDINDNITPIDSIQGTSYAAPQVSGLAALLMHRNPDLKIWPTAIKAIIMASAVHNIEGSSRLSDEDGAGAIHAGYADEIAQTHASVSTPCYDSCWWGLTTGNFPPWSTPHYEMLRFQATKGDLVRVAITWWSEADPPPSYPGLGEDKLATIFNLRVYSPSMGDQWVSESYYNNFEIVEFVAPQNGMYYLYVFHGATIEDLNNNVGVALLKRELPNKVFLPLVLKDS